MKTESLFGEKRKLWRPLSSDDYAPPRAHLRPSLSERIAEWIRAVPADHWILGFGFATIVFCMAILITGGGR